MQEMQGIENFRDLGGIPAAGGRRVRPRRLFRSGAIGHATEDDVTRMTGELGIGTVIDLRTRIERNGDPDPQIPGVRYVVAPLVPVKTLGLTFEDYNWRELLLGEWDPDTYDVCGIYRKMVDPRVSPRWHAVFQALMRANGKGVLFHCSNGKDRTGLVAAVVLSELGAGEDAIMADYARTNDELADRRRRIRAQALRARRQPSLADRIGPLLEARPEYVNAAFDAIDENYGDFATFLEQECGVGFAEDDMLHAAYLE